MRANAGVPEQWGARMSADCGQRDRVHRFADGELLPGEAEAVRAHLRSCAACQAELGDVLQLGGLAGMLETKRLAKGARASFSAPLPLLGAVPERRQTRWSRRLAWAGGASGAAAAALLLVFARPFGGQGDLYRLGDTRPLEARLTHAGASEFRRYDVPRAAGAHRVAVPLETLAKLEKAGDAQGLATAHLIRGERTSAAAALEKAARSPDVDSDRAVAALQSADPEAALVLLEGVLRAAPGHPQGLWNRGLALRDLGLPLTAAEAFDQVAALREPGWSEEAKARAEALRKQVRDLEVDWSAADDAGKAWVATGALPPEGLVRQHPGLLRVYFYDALRTAPDAAHAAALRPIAAVLDALAGSDVLTQTVDHVASADFAVRSPLAADYARLVSGMLDAPAQEKLLARLRGVTPPDLMMGTLWRTGLILPRMAEYKALAALLHDPWFTTFASQVEGGDLRQRDPLRTEQLLREAILVARASHFDYRVVELEKTLADVLIDLHRVPEAFAAALSAVQTARKAGERYQQVWALQQLTNAARLRWAFALARACLREQVLRRVGDCHIEAWAHLNGANAAILELRLDAARAEFDAIPPCGDPPDLQTVAVLADLSRLAWRPGDAQRLSEALRVLREGQTLSAGGRAMADHLEGRALIVRDPAAGARLLRASIDQAEALGTADQLGQKARAYSFGALVLEAARSGNFEEALRLLAQEQRVELPRACVFGVGVGDERFFAVASGADGRISGFYDDQNREPMDRFVPRATAAQNAALQGCAEVAVLARPPLQGRAALLGPEIAWGFGAGQASHAGSRGTRLIVSDVEPPASLTLPRLRTWGEPQARENGAVELRGAQATPSRVLAEMQHASEIEIHAHGFVDLALSDASLLALSPDPDGAWALSAAQVRAHPLAGHPLVILGACRAATGAPQLHAPWSLPAAFREAGASAVLASRADIPDAQAREFFDAVLAGARGGKPIAVALRDARVQFRSRPGGGWVDSVLLFQ